MAEFTAYAPGLSCWVDATTSERDAATAFYGGPVRLGGATRPAPRARRLHDVRGAGGRGSAGVMQLPDSAPRRATTFAVADADATCARAAELGGSIAAEPFDIAAIGRYAELVDPVGAAFGGIQDPPG